MFKTELYVRAEDPGEWVLSCDLLWDDGLRVLIVPRGFVTDLASLPRVARVFIDRNGASRKAAVLHDYLYQTGKTSRLTADRVFRDALTCCGVGWLTRNAMYLAVRSAGWMFYRGE